MRFQTASRDVLDASQEQIIANYFPNSSGKESKANKEYILAKLAATRRL